MIKRRVNVIGMTVGSIVEVREDLLGRSKHAAKAIMAVICRH